MLSPDLALNLIRAFPGSRILVVGDLMVDRFVYGEVERISPEAPVAVLAVTREQNMLGGAGNVARNIATLGGLCTVIGVVGADQSADALRQGFAAHPGIDTRLIVAVDRPTTTKVRHVAGGQQMLRADREVARPVSESIAGEILDGVRRELPGCAVVVLSDYAKGVVSEAVARQVISMARTAGKPVIVDPKGRSFGKYAGAAVLTPNRSELRLVDGEACETAADIERAARRQLDAGVCEAVLVTRGRDGMTLIERNEPARHIQTVAREVFDVSGAGDTVVATLALCIAGDLNLLDAAAISNVAAGIVVGKPGTAEVSAQELIAAIAPTSPAAPEGACTAQRAVELRRSWLSESQSVAFTNGCFDLLHQGHLTLLRKARASANKLIVGLNSDSSVRRLKGSGRPVQDQVTRAAVLGALRFVDAVVIFEEDTPADLVELLEPDVIVKGGDYTVENVVGADAVLRRGGRVLLVDLVPKQSTTSTISRIKQREEKVPSR